MKHHPNATANALAVVAAVWYVLCLVWVFVEKESYMGIMSTWFHGIDFAALPESVPTLTSAVIGFVSFVGFVWVSGYFFAVVYNSFVKK